MSDISKTLAIIGLLAPFGAEALGIGDIRSHSSLNQPLNAEIPLVLSGGDKLSNIEVRLASPEAFDKAGVERLHALLQLQFKPITRPDGRYVIEVSSLSVIQETFLDFLVEVESPQGTVLREFTLLLDPSMGQSQAPSFSREPAPYDEPTRPEQGWGRSHAYTSDPYDRSARSQTDDEASYRPASAARAAPVVQVTDETYGPVRRGETLIDIASRLPRPDDITSQQMATGLFMANPKAFKRTMRSLMAGSVLRIPSDEFLSQLNGGRSGSALPAGDDAEAGFRPDRRVGGASTHSSSSAGAGAVAEVSSRIPSALKRENEELKERLTLLEQRLEEADRMLALKNAELATLHSHEAEKLATPPEAVPPSVIVTPPIAETGVSTPAGETAPPAPASPSEATSAPAPIPSSPKTETKAPSPTLTTPVPAAPAESDDLMAPGFWQLTGVLTALGLGAWLYRRRRQQQDPADEPAEIIAASQSPVVEATPALPISIAVAPASLTPTENPVSTDILDPIWETDVYLRYGRFTQAEELMRETIRQEPDRDDLKQKLFEVLHLANQTPALTEYFQDLKKQHPDSHTDFWAPIRAMRPEFFPNDMEAHEGPALAIPSDKIAPSVDSMIVEDIELAPAPSVAESPDLDLDNTDFTDELRALEVASASLQSPEETHEFVSLETELADGIETLGEIKEIEDLPSLSTETESEDVDDLVAELTASACSVEEPADQDEGVLPGLDDTGLEEDLNALETESRDENGNALPLEPDSATPAIALESDEATEAPDNLMAFDTSELDLEFSQDTETTSDEALNLENLIAFDTTDLKATLAEISFKPQREQPATDTLLPLSESNELFPDTLESRQAISNPSFGALDFDLELIDPAELMDSDTNTKPGKSSSEITGTPADDFERKLEQANSLAEQNDKSAARALLQELLESANSEQRAAAESLLNEIAKVRLSLVQPSSRKAS